MGIQINGNTDTISAIDGALTVSGAELPTVTNLNATGIVTASAFVGNVTGNVTGNINATGVSTITTLNVTQSNLTNLNVSGVTTVSAGSASAPFISPSGDSNTGVYSPASDIISFTAGGSQSFRSHSFGSIAYHNDVSIGNSGRNETNNTAFVIKNKDKGQVAIQALWNGDGGTPTNAEMVFYSNPYSGSLGYYYRECLRLKTDGSLRIAGTTNCGLTTNSQISASGGLSLIGGNNQVAIARTDPSSINNNIFEIRNAVFGGDAILHFGSAAYNNYKCSIVARDQGNFGRMYVYFNARNSGDSNPLVIPTDTYFAYEGGNVYFPQTGTTAAAANAFLNSGSSPVNQLLRSTSSLVYKTDVEDLDEEYSHKIYDLRPIWYRSLADADRKDWSWYGFGAEEVAEIEPRLVHFRYNEDDWEEVTTPDPTEEHPDQVKTEKVLKSDAVSIPDGVMYDRLTVLIVKEMQLLNDRIKTLEAQNSTLQEQNATILARLDAAGF
jgi:hypothetical protein